MLDVALIRAESPAPLPAARLGDSTTIRVGDEVVAIGNPIGLDQTMTRGIVSGLNRLLLRVERALGSPEGLPRRPWYRHLIYAPGFYTGYGVKTLPGVREAIEQGDWAEAEREAARVGASLAGAARVIDSATALLAGPPGP